MKKYQYLASWDDQTLTRVGEPVVVLGDSNVSQVEVVLPSNFLLDPTKAECRMYFLLPGEKESAHDVLETAVKDENGDSHVTWTIKHVHSQKGGRLAFSLTLIGDDAQWDSRTAIIPVYESRYQPESEEAEKPYTGRLDALEGSMASIRGEFAEVQDDFEELKETATLGTPIPESLVANMTEGHVYIYTGTEPGYTAGHVYYYVGGALTDGGVYGGTAVDATLTQSGQAADAKKTGDEISAIKEDLSAFQTATSSDVGKALKAKTVTNGKVTEWEFGDAGGAVDTTLSIAGEAADAKVVGDALNEISENENLFDASSATDGYRIQANGTNYRDAGYYISNYIPVTVGVTYTKNSPTLDTYHRAALYTASKTTHRVIENNNTVTAEEGEAYIRFCGLLAEKSDATLYASNGTTAVDKTARNEIAANEAIIANVRDAFNTGLLKQFQLSWVDRAIDSTGLVVASNNRIITPVAYNFGTTKVRVSFPNEYKIWLYTYRAPEMTTENFVRRATGYAMESFSFNAESQYYYAFMAGHVDDSAMVISEGAEVTVEAETLFSASILGEISDVTFPYTNKGLISDNTPNFGNLVNSNNVSTSDYILIRNCNALLLKMPYYQQSTSFGLIFYDENKTALFGCPYNYYGSYGTEYRKYPIPYNAKYFRFSYFSDTSTYGEFVGYRIQDYPTKPYIFVAASNSSENDKHTADFVCDGVNDEVELQHAIYTARGEVVLAEGTYYIDSFQNTEGDGTVTALHFGKYGQQVIRFAGTGIGGTRKLSTGNVLFGGATIRVSRSCYDSLDNNTQYAIFGSVTNGASRIYPNVTASIENINFVIPDNQKKIICIDGWMMGALSFKNIKAVAVADPNNLKMPVDGCIGVRGLQGSNFGCGNRWESAFVWGFYEGYAVSGEHIVGADLGARYCNYGFTFNRKSITTGALLHPITMINCCDECNFNLPVFGKGGESRATDGLGGRQTINLIDFNMEWISSYYQNFGGALATELEPGQVYGSITYTVQTAYGGNTKNNVSQKFWANGSGMNVRTKNMAHAQSGTTAERNSYGATYMQTYYDTDLNKLLIYDGSNWRDMAGSIIS